MSTFVGRSVGRLVGLSKKCKKCKKWRIQPKFARTNCFNGGMYLRTFSIPIFFVFVSVSLSFTKFLKERQKAALDSVLNRR